MEVAMDRRFIRYAWFVLAYNVAVILWGAFVRATGSGAGCGEHWPLCNGVVVPRSPQLATIIELTHRLTSSLAGVFVIGLIIAAFRLYPKMHVVRRCATWSLALTITEGLLGAWLVLAGHVAQNASVWRGVSMTVHLVNTLFLLAALTCTAWFAYAPGAVTRRLNTSSVPFAVVGIGLLFIGVTGAIAALGDTLFASESVAQGMAADFSPASHIFVRLRILHPIAAVLIAAGLIVLSIRVLAKAAPESTIRRLATLLLGLITGQLLVGTVNLLLLAPIWLQILHLLAADAVWISFVLMAAESLYSRTSAKVRNEIPAPLTA
jgi:heme a synthase